MNTPVDKRSKFTVIHTRVDNVREIVLPIMEMSLLVLDLDGTTRRADFMAKSQSFDQARKKLAALLEQKFGRPFWPERLSNFHVSTHPLMGGAFDISFSESTPSKEGNINTPMKVRLAGLSMQTPLDRFVAFVRTNNPSLSAPYDMAREMITATGL